MKRELFVCISTFLFSKFVFKEVLNLRATYYPCFLCHSSPDVNVTTPFPCSLKCQPSQFPSSMFLRHRSTLKSPLQFHLESQKHHSLTHSFIHFIQQTNLLNKPDGKKIHRLIHSFTALDDQSDLIFLVPLSF